MPGALPRTYVTPMGTVEQQILAFFQAKGLTKAQAAGIAGNLQQESGLNPAESGGFLAQWLGTRLTGLERFAAGKHATVSGNTQVQLEYIWQELNTTESGALAALKQAKTPAAAATVFSQLYERPGQPKLANRIKYANEANDPTGGEPFTEGLTGATKAAESAVNTVTGLPGEILNGVGTLAIKIVLLLAGAVLIVYGIMVAVRPRESALSIPFPKGPVPVPV